MIQAFYCKGRPQDADIAEFSIEHKRVFIGYPPWRPGAELDKFRIRESIIDVSREDVSAAEPPEHHRQFTKNKNLVQEVSEGSETFVFLPRPGIGVCFMGRITGAFRVENAPNWIADYLALREKQGLNCEDEASHVGDVVQCWPVDFATLSPMPFPLIPGWIRYQIMGRNTAGIIRDLAPDMAEASAGEVAHLMHAGDWRVDLHHTLEPKEVGRRLVRWLTPNSFEHLAVSLLQLERKDEQWIHVGGSGDGGADGMAFKNGETTAVLQCKWKFDGNLEDLADELRDGNYEVLVAALLHGEISDNPRVLGRSWFVRKVIEHHQRLPQAIGLGIHS